MSIFLTVKDFDLSGIGERFEVQEIRDHIDKETGEILGHYYDCKILDGTFKKKKVTIRVDHYSRELTNDDVVMFDQVIVSFFNLEVSSIQPRRNEGLRVFYIAKSMEVLEIVG